MGPCYILDIKNEAKLSKTETDLKYDTGWLDSQPFNLS